MPTLTSTPHEDLVHQLVLAPDEDTKKRVGELLTGYPQHLLRLLVDMECHLQVLCPSQQYIDASPSLRRLGIDVNSWPVPPAGLFVTEDRTAYLRSVDAMTVGHETAHAIDCALGGGLYRSSRNPEIRRAFSSARDFVTPYAATAIDEYFAESARAYSGNFNSQPSIGPAAAPERLKACDPAMYDIMARIFEAPQE